MARSCEDLLRPAATPPQARHSLLIAQTRLRWPPDSDGEAAETSQAAALLLLDADAAAHQRLHVLERGFLAGRAQAMPLQEPGALAAVYGPHIGDTLDLVVAASEPEALATVPVLEAPGIRLGVCPQRGAPHPCPPQFDGLVYVDGDLAEGAIAVFQMVATMLAPELATCMDAEDLLALFSPTSRVHLAAGSWFDGRLYWREAVRPQLARARAAAMLLDSVTAPTAREARAIVSAVRTSVAPGAELLVNESRGFYCQGWPDRARPVFVLYTAAS